MVVGGFQHGQLCIQGRNRLFSVSNTFVVLNARHLRKSDRWFLMEVSIGSVSYTTRIHPKDLGETNSPWTEELSLCVVCIVCACVCVVCAFMCIAFGVPLLFLLRVHLAPAPSLIFAVTQ